MAGFDPKAYLAEDDQAAPVPQGTPAPGFDPKSYLNQDDESTAQKVLHSAPVQYGLRGLDYLGGMGRVAASGFAGMFKPQVLRSDDVLRMLKGQAPSTKEYLERAGVPQGPSLSDAFPSAFSQPGSGGITNLDLPEKGGPLDVTARGAAGFAGDTLTDPLTYLTMGTGNAARAAARTGQELSMADKVKQLLLRPAGTMRDAAGAKMYNSGLKNVDKVLEKDGKELIAPELMAEGKWGNARTMDAANTTLKENAGKQIGEISKKATDAGATVDMFPATDEAWEIVRKMKRSPRPEVRAAGEDAAELIQSYVKEGNVPLNQALEWARESNKFAGKKSFGALSASDATYGEALDRAIGQGIAKEASKSIKRTTPELHNDWLHANQVYGSAKEAAKPFANEISKETTKNGLSAIDWMLLGPGLGSAVIHQPKEAAGLLATFGAKKVGQGLNTMAGRTGGGLLLRKTATPLDSVMRRSAWDQLMEANQNQEENKK